MLLDRQDGATVSFEGAAAYIGATCLSFKTSRVMVEVVLASLFSASCSVCSATKDHISLMIQAWSDMDLLDEIPLPEHMRSLSGHDSSAFCLLTCPHLAFDHS